MIIPTQIKRKESLEKGIFLYHIDWFDHFKQVICIILLLGIVCLSIFLFLKVDFKNVNEKILSVVVMPLVLLFACYGLYRKLVERRLAKIYTSRQPTESLSMLIQYAEEREYEIIRQEEGLLILFDQSTLSWHDYGDTIVLLIEENELYYTILRDSDRANFPVFFSHWVLRYDLKKRFKT